MLRDGGYAVHGNLDSLVGRPSSADLRHPDDVTDAELLEAATQTIAAMLEDVRSLTRERDRLQRELERRLFGLPARVSVSGFWSRLRKAK
jgi:predicted ATPase